MSALLVIGMILGFELVAVFVLRLPERQRDWNRWWFWWQKRQVGGPAVRRRCTTSEEDLGRVMETRTIPYGFRFVAGAGRRWELTANAPEGLLVGHAPPVEPPTIRESIQAIKRLREARAS